MREQTWQLHYVKDSTVCATPVINCVLVQMHIVNKRKDLDLDEALKTPNGLAVLGFFIEVTLTHARRRRGRSYSYTVIVCHLKANWCISCMVWPNNEWLYAFHTFVNLWVMMLAVPGSGVEDRILTVLNLKAAQVKEFQSSFKMTAPFTVCTWWHQYCHIPAFQKER